MVVVCYSKCSTVKRCSAGLFDTRVGAPNLVGTLLDELTLAWALNNWFGRKEIGCSI
jgi:hypothetical protein